MKKGVPLIVIAISVGACFLPSISGNNRLNVNGANPVESDPILDENTSNIDRGFSFPEVYFREPIIQTNVSGLYYLRDDDLENMTDAGSLLRDAPLENEVTFCGAWVVFHFSEEGTYSGTNRIFNIYYRLWQKTPENPFEGEIFDLGYTTSGAHGGPMNESITINTSECITLVDNYRLVQAMQYTNPEIAVFEGDYIYNFSVLSLGNGPRIRTYPNQYSFVILNLEDNATLQLYDRDDDCLNDFDELFIYITNPFDSDTDNDGAADYEEVNCGTDPNNYLESIVYVDDDNNDGPWDGTPEYPYQYVQNGINAASVGDTVFVFNGTYLENIVVNKTINLIGEDKENTIIDGNGSGNVVNISADNVTIGGFTIQNAGSDYEIDWGGGPGVGLYVFADSGVYVLSDNNHIHGNIIRDNPYHGIHIHDYSDYNVISNNIVTNTPSITGIFLQFSSNNVIYNNTIVNNSHHGIHLLQGCNGNTISDNNITKNNCALEISGNWASNNNIITRNTIVNNRVLGIYLYIQCYNTIVSENIIRNNNHVGVVVYQMCDGSRILDNTIANHELGIIVEVWVDNISISDNVITNHSESGIELIDYVHNCIITRNTIANNNNGISILEDAEDNRFFENTIINNQRGVYSKAAFDNLFYHNNFIGNIENAYDRSANFWDGNYWDDYNGTDEDGDGIGDTPYNISGGNNQDNYPFMNPDGWITPSLTIVSACSCMDHGGTEWRLNLDENNHIEPRMNDVTTIEFDLSGSVSEVFASVDGQDGTVSYVDDDTIRVLFDPALPDQECSIIRFTCDVEDSYPVRMLIGDVNFDGHVTGGDRSTVKGQILSPLTSLNFWMDINHDGAITGGDRSTVKARIGNTVPEYL